MTHLYTILIKEIWQDATLKNIVSNLARSYSDKELFQIKQKGFPVFPDKKPRF